MKGKMKGKTKRFLSLLTVATLLVGQIPSAFADEMQEDKGTATSERVLDRIEVTRHVDEKYVGEALTAYDTEITGYYTDGSSEVLQNGGSANLTIVPHIDGIGPIVKGRGDNEFTVTYTAGDVEKKTTFNVWGYEVTDIETVYDGEDVLVGKSYDASNVSVKLIYSDNKERKTLNAGDVNLNGEEVTAPGSNIFDASYTYVTPNLYYVDGSEHRSPIKKDIALEDDIDVWGYKYIGLEVIYDGPTNAEVGTEIDEDDITVNAKFTSGRNGESHDIEDVPFTLDHNTVTDEGTNEFEVRTEYGNDTFEVEGYKESAPTIVEIKATPKHDVRVGKGVVADDVTITVVYDNKSEVEVGSNFVIKDQSKPSPVVTKAGKNEFDVTYTENGSQYTTKLTVWGYEIDRVEATYKGNDILVGENYDKEDVVVKAYWTERKDGTSTEIKVDHFDVDKTLVKEIGDNTYYATAYSTDETLGKDDFVVVGYDDRKHIEKIEAEYIGPDILVGNAFDSKDVIVTVTYTDGETEKVKDDFKITPFTDGEGPVVEVRKWNTYTVTYNGMEDDIQVWGYEPDKIEAEYIGPDILVNNQFASKDVVVDLIYSPFHDGKVKTETLKPNNYTLVNNDKNPDPTVYDVKWNDYTVTYNDFSDGIKVWGYKFDKLEAVYNGPAIYVGNNYAKKDVAVTAIYTPYHDNSVKKVNVDNFNVNSLLVTAVGSNTYKADCEYGEAPFVVPGIEKEAEKTNNIFTIVALDKDGNTINGVTVKYSTNGYQGTLETGKNNTAELGVGTVVTKEDCTVTVPEKYAVDTATMNIATGKQNTIYTLTIVVKNADKKEEVKKTANVIELVAVDTDGNHINGVSLTYSTNGYKGYLVTGGTASHNIGVGTVVTLDDCLYGIPDGYTYKKAEISSKSDDSHTVYTITVTVAKDVDNNVKEDPNCDCDPKNPKDKDGDGKCDCGCNVNDPNCSCNKVTPNNNNNKTPNKNNNNSTTDKNTPNKNTTTTVDIPQTGDESNAMLYMAVGGLALITILGLLVTKKKEDEEV